MLKRMDRPIYMCKRDSKDFFSLRGLGLIESSIVGKGNHSVNHVDKLKPRVEQVCKELGLQYSTEANAGRIYVNLTGGAAQMPSQFTQNGGGYQQNHGHQQHHGQQHGQQQYQGNSQYQGGQQYQQGGYPGQQQQPQTGGPQQNNQNDEMEAAVKKYLPKILRKIKNSCCTVM